MENVVRSYCDLLASSRRFGTIAGRRAFRFPGGTNGTTPARDKTPSRAICISHLADLDGGTGEGYEPPAMEVCGGPHQSTISHGWPCCAIAPGKESALQESE